jgi:hypothetical protein
MTYVIKRNDGAYVSRSGSRSSYTFKLEEARKFASEEEAMRNCCVENETIVPLERELNRFRS